MNTDNETLKHITEIWENLDKAMVEAGGRLNISRISKMTALEFIALIASNKLRSTTFPASKSDLKISH